ncbi:class II aldolase/adducin family protein [Yinghuangia aomiensis]
MTAAAEVVARLIDTGRDSVDAGLVLATGGNLSARVPGTDTFAVTGTGCRLDRLTPSDFAVMTLDGSVLRGAEPSSEWRLHQRTYQVRPDTGAIVHVHPEYAVLVDAMGERIRQVTLDHVAYAPVVERIPFHPNGSTALADAAADAPPRRLRRPGAPRLLDAGPHPGRGPARCAQLESAARYTYRMLLRGDRMTEFPVELREHAVHR